MIVATIVYKTSATAYSAVDLSKLLIDFTSTSIKESLNIIQGGYRGGYSSKIGVIVDNTNGQFTMEQGYLQYGIDNLSLYLNGLSLPAIDISEDVNNLTTTIIFEDPLTRIAENLVNIVAGDDFISAMKKVYISAGITNTPQSNINKQNMPQSNIDIIMTALEGVPLFTEDDNLDDFNISDVIKRCYEIGIYISGTLQNIIFLGPIIWTPKSDLVISKTLSTSQIVSINKSEYLRNRSWNSLFKEIEVDKIVPLEGGEAGETETIKVKKTINYKYLQILNKLKQTATQNGTSNLINFVIKNGIKKREVPLYYQQIFADLFMLCGLKNRRILSLSVDYNYQVKLGDIINVQIGKVNGNPQSFDEWNLFMQDYDPISIIGTYMVYAKETRIKDETIKLSLLELG